MTASYLCKTQLLFVTTGENAIYHLGNLLDSINVYYSPLHHKVISLTLSDSHVSRDFARVHSEPQSNS